MRRVGLIGRAAAALALARLLAPPPGAEAQSANCADHRTVVTRLAESYGETRQSIGLASNNTVVEVLASTETGTWTITVTRAGGPTCLIAAGEHYQLLSERLPDPGEDL